MIEPLFGAGSTLWTGVPTAGFAFQPPTPIGSGPAAAMSNSYNAPLGLARPGLAGPLLATGFPLAANAPGPLFGPEAVTSLTATSLLAAVAMRRGQPQGPTNDQEVEDFIYDALELLPGAGEVDVRCEGARATLTGNVNHKRIKRDIGEIAWAIPALNDVQNNVTIASRRRNRANREKEEPPNISARKQG
jgi:hypothetical protein